MSFNLCSYIFNLKSYIKKHKQNYKMEKKSWFWDKIIKSLISKLGQLYDPPKGSISIRLAILLPIVPIIGFVYLVFYFSSFRIPYDEISFNINDCISILYSKGIIFYFILLLCFTSAYPLLTVILNFFSSEEAQKKAKNWEILAMSLFCLIMIIVVSIIIKIIPTEGVLRLSIILAVAVYFYLFKSKNEGIMLGIVCFTFFCIIYAVNDANIAKQKKIKFNIILRTEQGPVKILSLNDPNKYFIKKTTEYLYIMDESENKVNIYPSSNIESMDFNVKW